MAKALLVSDLHLFTSRSEPRETLEQIKGLLPQVQYCVLAGDIFDFRWAMFKTRAQIIDAAVQWLNDLITSFPVCHFYYIMGNHDADEDLAVALKQIPTTNFSFSLTHFKVGKALYLHGDLPLKGQNPFLRTLHRIPQWHHKWPWLNSLYDVIVYLRLQHILRAIFTPQIVARALCSAFKEFPSPELNDIKHIGLGHTHVVINGFSWSGYKFWNVGSSIRYSPWKPIIIDDEKDN